MLDTPWTHSIPQPSTSLPSRKRLPCHFAATTMEKLQRYQGNLQRTHISPLLTPNSTYNTIDESDKVLQQPGTEPGQRAQMLNLFRRWGDDPTRSNCWRVPL